mmetsp:Transcript_12320/g.30924  ORF Transcript_12320/g.30924 Transcript_12320/m.30924 type:complete len:230 (-) Transcript_12320:144-833(-)
MRQAAAVVEVQYSHPCFARLADPGFCRILPLLLDQLFGVGVNLCLFQSLLVLCDYGGLHEYLVLKLLGQLSKLQPEPLRLSIIHLHFDLQVAVGGHERLVTLHNVPNLHKVLAILGHPLKVCLIHHPSFEVDLGLLQLVHRHSHFVPQPLCFLFLGFSQVRLLLGPFQGARAFGVVFFEEELKLGCFLVELALLMRQVILPLLALCHSFIELNLLLLELPLHLRHLLVS